MKILPREMKYVLDRKGRPVAEPDLHAWVEWFTEAGDLDAADDRIGAVRISTVFLGIDHAFDGGPPVLWETMVFGGDLDQEQVRYCTAREAEAGHRKMVERVKALSKRSLPGNNHAAIHTSRI